MRLQERRRHGTVAAVRAEDVGCQLLLAFTRAYDYTSKNNSYKGGWWGVRGSICCWYFHRLSRVVDNVCSDIGVWDTCALKRKAIFLQRETSESTTTMVYFPRGTGHYAEIL